MWHAKEDSGAAKESVGDTVEAGLHHSDADARRPESPRRHALCIDKWPHTLD